MYINYVPKDFLSISLSLQQKRRYCQEEGMQICLPEKR